MHYSNPDTQREERLERIYADDAENYFQKRAFFEDDGSPLLRRTRTPRIEYHWCRNNTILSTAYDLHQGTNVTYTWMKKQFLKRCAEKLHPLHNGVAFWQDFMRTHPTMTRIHEQDDLLTFFVATCSYGDIFNHALMRMIPKTLIRPGDLCADDYSKSGFQIIQETLQDQIKWFFFDMPELQKSLSEYSAFQRLWQEHLDGAKQLSAWAEKFPLCSFHPKRHSLTDADGCDALAHLFYQFVLFLNEYSNSAHKNADAAWNEYCRGDSGVLLNTMLDLAVLLKTDETIAKAAPIYLLLFFAKNAERLCKTGRESGKCTVLLNMTDLKMDERTAAKIYLKEQASSNIKHPKKAWVLTYQLLCSYFDKHPEHLKSKYDQALCEYIFEEKCALIGQTYYKMKEIDAVLDGILHEKKWVATSDFEESNKLLHPLICEIQKRLNQQLYILPRGGNIICEEEPGGFDGNYDNANKKDQMEISDAYLDVCVLDTCGIGCDHLSETVKDRFAMMLDQLASRRGVLFENIADAESAAAAFERGICKTGAQGVYFRYLQEVTEYLYRVLYSEEVASCADLFAGHESKCGKRGNPTF